MTKEQLHPGARWVFRFRGYAGGIFLGIFLGWFFGFIIAGLLNIVQGGSSGAIVGFVLSMIVVYIIIVLIIGEVYARMAYNRWFYEFTKEGLKLERGIIWKRYSNVPYERVQNVDVRRGILARMLGYSTVDIQTAGFHFVGGRHGGMPRSEGHLPAVSVEDAEKIREFLMKKISRRGSGGL